VHQPLVLLAHLGEIGKFSFDQFTADAGNDLFAPGIEQSGKCHATRRHRAAELAVSLHQIRIPGRINGAQVGVEQAELLERHHVRAQEPADRSVSRGVSEVDGGSHQALFENTVDRPQ
jgi:hypothetical protein